LGKSIKNNQITTLDFNFTENHVLPQLWSLLLCGGLVSWSNSFLFGLFGCFTDILYPAVI